ncbi:MAG TPA: AMP-binding protein [Acidimicrobiia bacterium]|nr:AMP-binding protein [Acidimicrobiia bacterium]
MPDAVDSRLPARSEAVLGDLLEARAAEAPELPFAVFRDEEWSRARTAAETWSIAAGLRDLGVEPGECVSSWLPNGPAGLLSWFGTNAAGGVYAPLNPAYRGTILEHTLNLAGSKVLLAHAGLVERLEGLNLEHLETVVVVGEGGRVPDRFQTLRWEDIERPGAVRPVLHEPREVWHDMALIYTSGTTGPSKAVRCSYCHHFTYAENLLHPELGAADRFFVCVPLFHASGTTSTYGMLARGGSVAVTAGFDTETYWDDVRKYGVTTAYIITAMVNFLNQQPPSPNDTDNPMRVAYMGPMIEGHATFAERFGIRLWTGYAMTEIPCITRTLAPGDHRSCGTLVDPENYEARVVDTFDREVPKGQIGELIVRHRRPWALNSGYRGMPEATATAWRNGWFHTGDAFIEDEQGNFFFVDRVKDAIRRRGENISSMEVEAEVLAHPAVAEAAAFAVPSPDTQEDEVKVVLRLRPGLTLEPGELIDFLVPRMPYFMVPRYLEVMEELPKTPSLKVEKYKLRRAGVTAATWDRVAAGIVLKREVLPT